MIKHSKIILFLLTIFFILKNHNSLAEEKIKIGLLVPMSGDNKEIGQSIIESTRLALKDINNNKIEIIPKDTKSDPITSLNSAKELTRLGVNIVIGPIFHNSLKYLDEVSELTFLSLTNKTIDIPNNVIASGINAKSQLEGIKKFIKLNSLKKTILLSPNIKYKNEIDKAVSSSKINILKSYYYDMEPTKLTSQIEDITNYKIRKQNLADEIRRLENSEDSNKEKKIENLKKRYTIGRVNFDSIIITDFDESLKSVATSLLYTDVSPKEKYFITLNQWFDESLLKDNSIQPIYFPSVDKKEFNKFQNRFYTEFRKNPNHLMLLSYDLVGLIYYLSLNNNLADPRNLFKKDNSFKGKIGIFNVKNNKIQHSLNFYKIQNKKFIKIF